jgi:F-type H+-transporting ATPase subunit b
METSPDLVFGIELHLPGCKIAWSLADYLESFEQKLAEALEAETNHENSRQ